MPAILWRVIIAVLAVVLIFALIPPLADVLGFPVAGSLLLVLKICIVGLALFYILKGNPVSP